jgi:hypothetical protein
MWPFKNRSSYQSLSNDLLQNKELNSHSSSVKVFTGCFDSYGRQRILATWCPILGTTGIILMVHLNIYSRHHLARFFLYSIKVLICNKNLVGFFLFWFALFMDRPYSLWKDRIWKQVELLKDFFRQNYGSWGPSRLCQKPNNKIKAAPILIMEDKFDT